jgi:glycosyltransferase involved in cell wall biosynthesis
MRIGIVTQWPFPDTVDYRCRKMIESLVAAGHELTVFTAEATGSELVTNGQTVLTKSPYPRSKHTELRWEDSPSPLPGNPYWTMWLLAQTRRLRLDWLMSKDLRLGMSTHWAARASGTKFWIDLAEPYPAMVRIERAEQLLMPLYAAIATFLEKRCAHAADLVTVVTESNRERLTQLGVSKSRVVVVSNTPLLRPMPTRNGAAVPGKLNFVYAGILSKVRGLERLLKALSRIGPENESVCLHIVGEGSEAASLQALTETLKLTNCVQFHGWVAKAELSSLFARCDVGIIPHLLTDFTQTTIPNKLFDYMACGLPVWATNMRPCLEVIETVDCGWVSDDTVDGMAAVLRTLVSTSREDYRAKGERGRQAVLKSYNWEVDTQRMLEVLASLN